MVCCQAQNCCPQLISFSGATVLTGLLNPFLYFPIFWLFSFLYPILTALSFRRILYTDHEGQSQMCLAYFPLTGCGWCWPKSFSAVTLRWKEHAIGDVALWLGQAPSGRTESLNVASNYHQWFLHWQFFRRHSKADFHDEYKKHSSDTWQPLCQFWAFCQTTEY